MTRSAAAVLAFVLATAAFVLAESNVPGPEARFQRLSHELKLTDQQKLKVLLRMQEEDRTLHAIRADAKLSDSEKDSKIASVRQKTMDDIRELLTAAQQFRLSALNATMTSAQSQPPAR